MYDKNLCLVKQKFISCKQAAWRSSSSGGSSLLYIKQSAKNALFRYRSSIYYDLSIEATLTHASIVAASNNGHGKYPLCRSDYISNMPHLLSVSFTCCIAPVSLSPTSAPYNLPI